MALAKEHGDATEHGGLLLDLTPNFKKIIGAQMFEFLKRTFPSMIDAVKHAYGEQAARGQVPWDVFPTAHYQLGGVRVDSNCKARGLNNLFAVGEVQGGLYGANRIASTSLADIFIFGSLAGESAAEAAHQTTQPELDLNQVRDAQSAIEQMRGKAGSYRPVQLMRRLQRTMWEDAGPVRDERRLLSAIEGIGKLREQLSDINVGDRKDCNSEWLDAIELEKMLLTGESVVRSALERKESRGGQVRTDFPKRDDENWLKHVVVKKTGSGLEVRMEDVDLKKYGPGAKGGPHPTRERIQFIILGLLPRKMQERILDARLNLREDN
jgi:succinate dehydrogenase/fumarate reductase flavoprotein subunit